MLANNLAEVISNCPAAVVSVGGLWRKFLRLWRGCGSLRERTDFLNGADADAVSFPQGAVDSASFGNAHFGTLDEERDIGRVGIAIANKASTGFGLVHSSLERPMLRLRVAKVRNGFTVNTCTAISGGQSY